MTMSHVGLAGSRGLSEGGDMGADASGRSLPGRHVSSHDRTLAVIKSMWPLPVLGAPDSLDRVAAAHPRVRRHESESWRCLSFNCPPS